MTCPSTESDLAHPSVLNYLKNKFKEQMPAGVIMKKSILLILALGLYGCNNSSNSNTAALNEDKKTSNIITKSEIDKEDTKAINKTTYEGPFGLKMGLSKKELTGYGLTEASHGIYTTISVPKPHELFENYYMVITDETGLCLVFSSSKDIPTSEYGTELKNEFESLQSALIEKYGIPTIKADRLFQGSIWNEPRDWMTALLKKERLLASSWSNEGKESIGNDIESITLEANAPSTSNGVIRLNYRFKNFKSCKSEINKASNAAL